MNLQPTGISQDGRTTYLLWAWDESFKLIQVTALQNRYESNTFWSAEGGIGTLGHVYFESKAEAYNAGRAVLDLRAQAVAQCRLILDNSNG